MAHTVSTQEPRVFCDNHAITFVYNKAVTCDTDVRHTMEKMDSLGHEKDSFMSQIII